MINRTLPRPHSIRLPRLCRLHSRGGERPQGAGRHRPSPHPHPRPHHSQLGRRSSHNAGRHLAHRYLTSKSPWPNSPIAGDGPDFIKKAATFPAASETFQSDLNTAQYHSVRFSPTQSPAPMYAYRVGDGFNWSEWNQFRTAEPGPAPVEFLYVGDAQNDIYPALVAPHPPGLLGCSQSSVSSFTPATW
jgi:hypothetical protein